MTTGLIILVLLAWLSLSLLGAVIAKRRGRSGTLWFLIGLLLGGGAAIIVWLLPAKPTLLAAD